MREARDRSPKSPRWSAERRASPRDARRLVRRLACRVKARPRVPEHPSVISALRHPSSGCAKQRKQNPGAKTRRGNEETCAV